MSLIKRVFSGYSGDDSETFELSILVVFREDVTDTGTNTDHQPSTSNAVGNDKLAFWFEAPSLVRYLGYSNINKTLRRLPASHCKSIKNLHIIHDDIQENTIFVSKRGLWALLNLSKKPIAIELYDWLVYEILPNIVNNKMYILDVYQEDGSNTYTFVRRPNVV